MWTKIRTLDTKWKVLISVTLVVAIWAGGSETISRINVLADCKNFAKMAESAFSEGNFYEAEKYYAEIQFGKLTRFSYVTCPNRPYTSTGLSIDQMRLGELQSYNRAAREKEGGDYYSAVQTLQLYLEHPGELKEEAELLLSEVYQALATDTGQSGARLLLDMYEASCGLGENEMPPIDMIVNNNAEIKYWYPDANTSNSNYIAKIPAEFRIAICYELIQSDIVETCVYTQTGSLGSGGLGSSTVRKNAIYEIQLRDILTGKTIAKYQPMYSNPPAACPQTMSGTTMFNEIIGEPDFTTVISWIDEQMQSLLK